MSKNTRTRELCDLPRVGTTLHPEVLDAFKADAKERGLSTATVLREVLYEYARDYLCVEVEAPRPTTYART